MMSGIKASEFMFLSTVVAKYYHYLGCEASLFGFYQSPMLGCHILLGGFSSLVHCIFFWLDLEHCSFSYFCAIQNDFKILAQNWQTMAITGGAVYFYVWLKESKERKERQVKALEEIATATEREKESWMTTVF